MLCWRSLTSERPGIPIFASKREEILERPRKWTKEKVSELILIDRCVSLTGSVAYLGLTDDGEGGSLEVWGADGGYRGPSLEIF